MGGLLNLHKFLFFTQPFWIVAIFFAFDIRHETLKRGDDMNIFKYCSAAIMMLAASQQPAEAVNRVVTFSGTYSTSVSPRSDDLQNTLQGKWTATAAVNILPSSPVVQFDDGYRYYYSLLTPSSGDWLFSFQNIGTFKGKATTLLQYSDYGDGVSNLGYSFQMTQASFMQDKLGKLGYQSCETCLSYPSSIKYFSSPAGFYTDTYGNIDSNRNLYYDYKSTFSIEKKLSSMPGYIEKSDYIRGFTPSDPDVFYQQNFYIDYAATSLSIAVPEPATWALMLVGFGAVAGAMRQRKSMAQEKMLPVLEAG
jgi:hypothetical protein